MGALGGARDRVHRDADIDLSDRNYRDERRGTAVAPVWRIAHLAIAHREEHLRLGQASRPDGLGPEGSQFKSVVLIEFPSPGMWSLGFNTGTMKDKTGKTFVKVYVPTTPNPTSGFLELLPEEDVKKTDITVEDALKMIISGGILSPEKFEIRP